MGLFLTAILWITCLSVAFSEPLKVFILAGQSNMVGKGHIPQLEEFIASNDDACGCNEFRDTLMTSDGTTYKVLNNAYIDYLGQRGQLELGKSDFGDPPANMFGPEMMIGYTLNEALDEPFLMVKVAYGGNSLYEDFRPPSSGFGDICAPDENIVGDKYRKILSYVNSAVNELETIVPGYDPAQGYELAGLIWFHGWNDLSVWSTVYEYESNLANLIRDLRNDLGAPNMPVVVGELGQHGVLPPDYRVGRVKAMRGAQRRVTEMDEFKDNTLFVETHPFVVEGEPEDQYDAQYHYYGRADNFFYIGKALGRGMLELMGETVPPDYDCSC